MDFNTWLINEGKSGRTAKSYSGAIKGVLSDWVISNNIDNVRLDSIHSYGRIKDIVNQLEEVDIYIQRNRDGNSMYSAALKKYIEYLYEWSSEDIQDDINSVLQNNELEKTEKSTLISTRIGQGVFRNSLIDYWKGCAVTGYRDTSFLVASHIKPWRMSDNNERLDPFNGLLLLPNLDKAFDLGYISFQTSGEIKVSSLLQLPIELGISDAMRINISNKHQAYMEYHRNEVYQS